MSENTWSDIMKMVVKIKNREKKIEALGYTHLLHDGYFRWVKNSDIVKKEGWFTHTKPDAIFYDDIELPNE